MWATYRRDPCESVSLLGNKAGVEKRDEKQSSSLWDALGPVVSGVLMLPVLLAS